MKTYSLVYRLLHWGIAFSMLFLLLTVFLRTGWMNRTSMAETIQTELKQSGYTVDEQAAGKTARKIRQPMWQWHIYFGYALVALFSLRFLLPFIGVMRFQNPLRKGLSMREKFQFWVYLIFYLGVSVSLFTGMMLEWGPENLEDSMERIHVLSLYYLLPYIVLHLGGVLLAEIGHDKGIVSRIINGGR